MAEKIAIAVIALGAIYYIYYSLFRKKGCGCGKDSCASKKKEQE